MISSTFGPAAGTDFNGASGAMSKLLGLGTGNPFQTFQNSDGYNFLLNSGSRAITDNAASRGLLNSGSTLKALNTFGQNLGSTQLQSYLGDLGDLGKLGLGGGSLVSDAGQFSNSQSQGTGSQSSGGLGSFLGSVMAAIPFL